MNKPIIFLSWILTNLCVGLQAQDHPQTEIPIDDIMSDTWVAHDGLGRLMPTSNEVGNTKTDKERTVGIFYVTWHTRDNHYGHPYASDVTRILAADDSARFDADRPIWKDKRLMLHWGEPEYGYFLSQDEYVCRHDLSMLADAGVDVLIMDVTNAVHYWDEWEVLFSTMQAMKKEGNKVPQMCFWAFNGNAYDVVQKLYDRYYATRRYEDLWFYWEGKPLLLYNAHPQAVDSNGSAPNYNGMSDYSDEVKSFFTLRNMWWGYNEWAGKPYVGTDDNWSFGYELNDPAVMGRTPEQLAAHHNGIAEEMAVTPAQHPITGTGKCWRRETREPELGKGDMPVSTYVPWANKMVDNPSVYGIYFQDRWDEALQVDPSFIYLNDWNEWTAGRWPFNVPFLGRDLRLIFVDQYNAEFNRTIAPAKDKAIGDNYYMQMVQNIRRYKGVRPVPVNRGVTNFRVNGQFRKWNKVDVVYRDTRGDTFHRDEDGYGNLHYVNTSGRNDIVESRVAMGQRNVLFYVKTTDPLTACTDPHWMVLFIDADQNGTTGWCGFDYAVNMQVKEDGVTTLMQYAEGQWKWLADLPFAQETNMLEVSIPRDLMGWTGQEISFDFKWSDNAATFDDALSLCTDGDAAPNRRFCYRYIWKK